MLRQKPAVTMEEMPVPSAPPAPEPSIPEEEISIIQQTQSSISQPKLTIPEKKTFLKSDPTIPRSQPRGNILYGPRPISLPPRPLIHVPTQFYSCQFIQHPMAYLPSFVPSQLHQ